MTHKTAIRNRSRVDSTAVPVSSTITLFVALQLLPDRHTERNPLTVRWTDEDQAADPAQVSLFSC